MGAALPERRAWRLAHVTPAPFPGTSPDAPGSPAPLELLPFVRVIAGGTGQDACYFYNRVEGAEIRWVSYHFHADPELLLPDQEVIELLATLNGTSGGSP